MKKVPDIKGIRFQTWLQYMLFSLFIIGFLWVTQVAFLELFYTDMELDGFGPDTLRILKVQLWITTFSIISIAVGVSVIVSSLTGQGISELSKGAEKLAKGDYSVQFDVKGYTEVKELANTLNYAANEMKKTEGLRRELIANVSHDLRTPLTIIKGYAELIKDISGKDKMKREEHLDIIIREADRLTILVRDMLNLSQMESDGKIKCMERINISKLVAKVTDSFNIFAEKDQYVFINDITPDLHVIGDGTRLELVVYNLISNAVNYTGDDKKVIIRLFEQNGNIKFEVEDTGCGLSEQVQKEIWQRYYRAKEHKRNYPGSGLGLSIVKSILDYHKSDYGVISEEGKGSVFYFYMSKAD
ncbi:MAG: HAMP domain-containing histidine kinase [Clostridia bacterium]|nr:HAMP domain-containing histidine kinase [Clostridia bacterium]